MNANTPEEQRNESADTDFDVRKWMVKAYIGVLVMAAILFGAAWQLDWLWGWVYIGLYASIPVASALILDPELLAERETPHENTKGWDKVVLGLYGLLLSLVTPVVAALDERFGWLPEVSPAIQIGAVIVFVLGWAVHFWAMVVNRFHSKVVRIQEDRGHTVATGGPYRYVRHPAYVGAMALSFGTALILGSVWALIPGGLGALLIIVRTALEDKTLREELPGYAGYAERVRYRLLPGIW